MLTVDAKVRYDIIHVDVEHMMREVMAVIETDLHSAHAHHTLDFRGLYLAIWCAQLFYLVSKIFIFR